MSLSWVLGWHSDRIEIEFIVVRPREPKNNLVAPAESGLGMETVSESPDDAIAQFRIILGIYPNDAEMHCNVGTLLLQQGAIDEAIKEFDIALKLNPNFGRARQQLEAASALKDR